MEKHTRAGYVSQNSNFSLILVICQHSLGTFWKKKNMCIYQTYVCSAMTRGSEENDVP